ncbi:MAG: fumarylacetoacetate hydrolase family protein [Ignavibacteria bacterium]|nr:fumarylacetoacetate hydrolase family protein [Ignavibacteria bacterium]MBT8382415.1 fumarylacetoacetate hydrolase family protein [Ignavibacteria bacterium]MBT8390786.1 fumarylacetoacetate hydrolase family protein [Ignavibacteria bacterium]NNJ52001.1 fumarylacetoacetate hydrolase family protein [Ignavibacteriaceae bacterium]NNL20158.1 fumarylacetoacetate hydrolase family protein [Ignavibacteriaceae bacterium]
MKSVQIKNSDERYSIGKIVCIGRNYAKHAKELGNKVPEKPVLFLKPASVVIHSGGKVVHPNFSNELHHEVELVLLIGKDVKNASKEEAKGAIIGYGVGLDMTLRDIQKQLRKVGDPWTIAKCFDTSAVISDFTLKEDYKLTFDEIIQLKVNGEIKQSDKLKSMIFNPAELVEYISSVMTLEKGDLIFTGTPSGVSKVIKGDKLEAKLGEVAELICTVV